MTRERLAELRALADAATPGPWRVHQNESNGCKTTRTIVAEEKWVASLPGAVYLGLDVPEDAAFIATARTALPELLDEIERLQANVGPSFRDEHGYTGPVPN